jgi:Nif-specific regulatory protein
MPADVAEALYRISQLFNSILEPDELLERVVDEALRVMNAERGLLVLAGDDGRPEVRVARDLEGGIEKALGAMSQTALAEVLAKREPKVYLDAPGAFPASQSIIVGNVRSIAVAPLVCRERVLGAIYLDSRSDRNVFRDDSLPFIKAFAGIAALAIDNARLYAALSSESSQLRSALRQWQRFPEIIGGSAAMQSVVELMNRVIPSDAAVLIQGETGTGKELVARAIHYNGPRAAGPFVPVNCGAMPANLLEAELFGHRKGAFTGAVVDRKGLFEAAGGGSIFLDEIAELPLELQSKLLRVLQDGEVRRVGDTRPFHVDVRVISATNRNLAELVAARKFRDDLFYRLNVIPIELPPLRRRREDIAPLVGHFVKSAAQRQGKPVEGVAPAALALLEEHAWPGNVRELENAIERAVVLCAGTRIEPGDVVLTAAPAGPAREEELPVAEIEKRVVLERLARFNGNRTRTAASLGISRRTLLNKLAEWQQDEAD